MSDSTKSPGFSIPFLLWAFRFQCNYVPIPAFLIPRKLFTFLWIKFRRELLIAKKVRELCYIMFSRLGVGRGPMIIEV